MYTQQEKQQLDEMRAKCERRFDIRIKPVTGGYLVTTTEIFVDGDTVVGSAQREAISATGYGASRIVQELFENETSMPVKA